MKRFSVDWIREKWLEIFLSKGYFFLPSASLIPEKDDSLLWINSGVAAIKKYFNDPQLKPCENLVNCQKVIRTDDIQQINASSYHQTLFEMLGCFSIDGNFKRETIAIVWEFFTGEIWCSLSPSRLIITVWENDEESYQTWLKQPNLIKNNIIKGSKLTNFWDMGDGPCGPNTEVYYDFSPESGEVLKVEQLEEKRFLEIGNIVFPEFYHKENNYSPLGRKCVDTGVGLERVAMVLQGQNNSFKIDIWDPIIKKLENFVNNNLN